jgi:hypothetical protein
MEVLAREATRAEKDGYLVVHYQIVNDRLTVLYHKAPTRADLASANLVGE